MRRLAWVAGGETIRFRAWVEGISSCPLFRERPKKESTGRRLEVESCQDCRLLGLPFQPWMASDDIRSLYYRCEHAQIATLNRRVARQGVFWRYCSELIYHSIISTPYFILYTWWAAHEPKLGHSENRFEIMGETSWLLIWHDARKILPNVILIETSVFSTIFVNSSKLIFPSRSWSASIIVLSTIYPVHR